MMGTNEGELRGKIRVKNQTKYGQNPSQIGSVRNVAKRMFPKEILFSPDSRPYSVQILD